MINLRRFHFESVRFAVRINNQIHMLMMITQTKEQYIAPECEVLTLQEEGVICASDVKGGNSINDWGNGGNTNDDLYM